MASKMTLWRFIVYFNKKDFRKLSSANDRTVGKYLASFPENNGLSPTKEKVQENQAFLLLSCLTLWWKTQTSRQFIDQYRQHLECNEEGLSLSTLKVVSEMTCLAISDILKGQQWRLSEWSYRLNSSLTELDTMILSPNGPRACQRP